MELHFRLGAISTRSLHLRREELPPPQDTVLHDGTGSAWDHLGLLGSCTCCSCTCWVVLVVLVVVVLLVVNAWLLIPVLVVPVAVTTLPVDCILDAVTESIISTSSTVASLIKISLFSAFTSYKLPNPCEGLARVLAKY